MIHPRVDGKLSLMSEPSWVTTIMAEWFYQTENRDRKQNGVPVAQLDCKRPPS